MPSTPVPLPRPLNQLVQEKEIIKETCFLESEMTTTSNNNKEYFEPLIGIDKCVHVSPIKIGSKVRPPAIADPANRR